MRIDYCKLRAESKGGQLMGRGITPSLSVPKPQRLSCLFACPVISPHYGESHSTPVIWFLLASYKSYSYSTVTQVHLGLLSIVHRTQVTTQVVI